MSPGAEAEPYIRDATLDKQLFTYQEKIEDPVRPGTPASEGKPDI